MIRHSAREPRLSEAAPAPAGRPASVGRGLHVAVLLLAAAVPAGDLARLPGEITVGRALTVLLVAAALGRGLLLGRLRRPRWVHALAFAFVLLAAASIFWAPDTARALRRAFSFAQLAGLMWLLWEVGGDPRRRRHYLQAFALGSYATALVTILAGMHGQSLGDQRYTAMGFNADDLGASIGLGIPVALYLTYRAESRLVRWLNLIGLPMLPAAVALTASRGAAVMVGAEVVVAAIALRPRGRAQYLRLAVVMVAAGLLTTAVVPKVCWDRLATLAGEARAPEMGGRVDIWRAGMAATERHPVVGWGAGAFGYAIAPALGRAPVAHNVPLEVLVEHGLMGLLVFATLFGAIVVRAIGRRSPERGLWIVVLTGWCFAASFMSWENYEITWLIWGLAATAPLAGPRAVRRPAAPRFSLVARPDGTAATAAASPSAGGGV